MRIEKKKATTIPLLYLPRSLWPPSLSILLMTGLNALHASQSMQLSRPGLLETPSATPPAVSKPPHPKATGAIPFANYLEPRDCPVPCGYYSQLCCNDNEICYTNPSDQAECSATASPFPPSVSTEVVSTTLTSENTIVETSVQPASTVISISVISTTDQVTLLSTYEATRNVTQSPSTDILTASSTLLETTDSVTAGSSTSSEMPANPTATDLSSGSENRTVAFNTEEKQQGWPVWEKGVVGAVAGVGSLAILGLLLWAIIVYRRKRNRKSREHAQRETMEQGDHSTFRQLNTGLVLEPTPQRLQRNPSSIYYNPPRPEPLPTRTQEPNEYDLADIDEQQTLSPSPPPYRGVSPLLNNNPLAGHWNYGGDTSTADYDRRSASAPLHPGYSNIPAPTARSRRSQPTMHGQSAYRRPVPPPANPGRFEMQ